MLSRPSPSLLALKHRAHLSLVAVFASAIMTETLIWINGPFGLGKTQLAFELHLRLAGSNGCDPEYV